MNALFKEKETSTGNIKALFEPKSIAVIGASRREDSVGYAILHNLVESNFAGELYPVNPKANDIEGIQCYSSLTEIEGDIDLAVIIVQNKLVPGLVQECADKSIKAVIVISAGFREIGEEGRNIENQVIDIARKHNIAMLGPNCLGLINTDPKYSLNASFSRFMPKAGNIGFISQSGALCAAILDYVKGKNIGFSKFVSLGNKADINEVSLLQYLKDDPQTDVILMYIEDIVDGHKFIQLAHDIVQNQKPILVIKSGRTAEGAKAASSHTGSLMGSDKIYDAIFAQAGVLRLDSVADIFNYAVAFAYQPLPQSNRVAIITNAGGPGIMATDACISSGIKMSKFDESTIHSLKDCLPVTANYSNPVDVIGDAQHDRYQKVLEILSQDNNIDGILVILTPQAMTDIDDIAEVIVNASKKTDKTILVSFMGGADVASGRRILEANSIPQYDFPEDAAKTFAKMVEYKALMYRTDSESISYSCDKDAVSGMLSKCYAEKKKFLTIDQSMDIFKAYGLPVLPYGMAKSEGEAVVLADKISYPVVMKVVSQDIIHKVDVGGVILNLNSAEDVGDAYKTMMLAVNRSNPKAHIDAVFIQKQANQGREVILGMHRDEQFGPVIMFGMGGIYVELLKDISFRLAPLNRDIAHDMITNIKAYPILKGARGENQADLECVIECLIRLSQLVCDHPQIEEVDINPLVAYSSGNGCAVLDARIILS